MGFLRVSTSQVLSLSIADVAEFADVAGMIAFGSCWTNAQAIVSDNSNNEDAVFHSVAEFLVSSHSDGTKTLEIVHRWFRSLAVFPVDVHQQHAIQEIHQGIHALSLLELQAEAKRSHALYRSRQLLEEAINPLFLCAILRVAVEADPEVLGASIERAGELWLLRYSPPTTTQDRNFLLLRELSNSRLKNANPSDIQRFAVMLCVEKHLVQRELSAGVHNAAKVLIAKHPHLPGWMLAQAVLLHAEAH